MRIQFTTLRERKCGARSAMMKRPSAGKMRSHVTRRSNMELTSKGFSAISVKVLNTRMFQPTPPVAKKSNPDVL